MQETDEYILNIDSPNQAKLSSREISLQGWIIVKPKVKYVRLRIKQGDDYISVTTGIKRHDVAEAFPAYDTQKTENCGFEQEFECVTDTVVLEIDTGEGYSALHTFEFEVSSPYKQYNPYLASNWMNHKNLLETKKFYYHEPFNEYEASAVSNATKVVALYLPQFHPIEENDIAWGKGFTEWKNVASAEARFAGHNQPLFPADLGYYDLRIEDNIKTQIDLAKNYGLYGFCLYYYWFSGKKILDTPINTIIKHKEWDFNFMICWANENWTKRWDGREKEVIIEQKYLESDPLDFIKDVEHIITDPRYIQVHGKPVLAVYRCEHLDDATRYAKVWREYIKSEHNLDLELVSVMSFEGEDPKTYGFDSGLEFAPSNILRSNDPELKATVSVKKKLIDPFFDGIVFDYRSAVNSIINTNPVRDYNYYACVMPSWDNDARKKGNMSYVFTNESPDIYKKWLQHAVDTVTTETPIVFVNAWNEWAEGTVLEPTSHYGHAHLNKTAEVLQGIDGRRKIAKKSVAIVYIDSYDAIAEAKKIVTSLVSVDADISVTIASDDLRIEKELSSDEPNVIITTIPQRGDDILSFFETLKRIDYSHCDAIIKISLVEGQRSTAVDLAGSEKRLKQHISKVSAEKTVIFSNPEGVVNFKSKKSIIQYASLVTSPECIRSIDLADIIPEDFAINGESADDTTDDMLVRNLDINDDIVLLAQKNIGLYKKVPIDAVKERRIDAHA